MKRAAVAFAVSLSLAGCGSREGPSATASAPAAPTTRPAPARSSDAAPAASAEVSISTRGKGALPDTKCPAGLELEPAGCVEVTSAAAPAFRKAIAAYRAWLGTGSGSGPQARAAAFAALSAFHERWAADPTARVMVVEVTYAASFVLHAGEERDARAWDRKTIEAWERLAKDWVGGALALRGTRPSELAALAELQSIDREIWDTFDYETGHLRLEGTVAKAMTELAKDEKRAEVLQKALERVASGDTYGSPRAVVDAIARQGSLYESLRAALLPAEAVVLDGTPAERDAWTKRREKAIIAAEDAMVSRYVTAIAAARGYGVASSAVKSAWKRLGELETPIGEARMRGLVAGTGLTYAPGMFKAPFVD